MLKSKREEPEPVATKGCFDERDRASGICVESEGEGVRCGDTVFGECVWGHEHLSGKGIKVREGKGGLTSEYRSKSKIPANSLSSRLMDVSAIRSGTEDDPGE